MTAMSDIQRKRVFELQMQLGRHFDRVNAFMTRLQSGLATEAEKQDFFRVRSSMQATLDVITREVMIDGKAGD